MSKLLEGRVAVVTGAGRGIGRAIAIALAEKGATVIAVARTFSEIEATAENIDALGGQAYAIQADIGDYEAVSALVDNVLKDHGKIDVLVNNAGVQNPIGPLVTNDWQAWQQNIRINLFGTFNTCHAVLPSMIARKSGKIINLSGGGATAPRPSFSAYGAAKAAIVRLTETLAKEVQEHNIQVNAIAPGAVNTQMLEEVLQAGDLAGAELAGAQTRKKEGGTPPELAANLVLFLASDASLGLTGKLIAAPHDDWTEWDEETIDGLNATPWLTLRRIDPFTISPLTPEGLDKRISANVRI